MGGVEREQAHTVALGFTCSRQPACDGGEPGETERSAITGRTSEAAGNVF